MCKRELYITKCVTASLSLCLSAVSKCYIHWDELMNECKSEVYITKLVSTFTVSLTKFEYELTGVKHFEMH